MKTLLICNLSTKTANAGDDAWTPPPFRFGESLTLALRFTEDRNGITVEPDLTVASLRAGIGRVDARPESGKFALQFGDGAQTADNTIDAQPFDVSPGGLQAAINAKTAITVAFGTAAVTKLDDTYRIVFGDGEEEVAITARDNTLFPVSFAHVDAYQVDGQWQHFVRLIQAEVAFTSSAEAVLPDAPTITRITEGGTSGEFAWNELQSLRVPPDFRATYIIRYGDTARTAELTVNDGIEQIQAALEAVLGENFKVTEGINFSATIEFINDLAGASQPLMTIEALSPPPGDLTFTLALDRAELETILRRVESVTLPLQVWLTLTLDDDTTQTIVAFTTNVTLQRPLIWPEQATTQSIDWLRAPSPKDYKPFNPDNVITGQEFYSELAGDGAATSFVVDHALDTELVHVWVRENVSNGLQLIEGTDFRARITNANSVTVAALGDPPALNAWRVTIVSAQTVGAFAEGLAIEIAQVTGLQAILDSLAGRVSDLEDLAPTTPLVRTTDGATAVKITLAPVMLIFPGIFPAGFNFLEAATSGAGLLAAPMLLPAVHDATADNVSTILVGSALPAPSTQTNKVFVNDTAGNLHLPATAGRTGTIVPVNGFVASDGVTWYRVEKWHATKSYFAVEHTKRLAQVAVNDRMLRAGQTMTLGFDLKVALLKPNMESAKMLLRIEVGQPTVQATPATTADNLEAITWVETAMMEQAIVITGNAETHHFGVAIIRDDEGAFTANQLRYNAWSAAGAVPPAANFLVRVVLRNLDTPNAVTSPRGFVFADFKPAEIELS